MSAMDDDTDRYTYPAGTFAGDSERFRYAVLDLWAAIKAQPPIRAYLRFCDWALSAMVSIVGHILCWLGWHRWRFTYRNGTGKQHHFLRFEQCERCGEFRMLHETL